MLTTLRMLRQPTSPKRRRYPDISSRKSIQRRSENAVHPSWGYHAEELLFYTSRYYAQTETFLRAISGVSDFSFDGFRAQRLTPAQQQSLARLLRRPAGHATARAVVALIRRITICRGTRARIASRSPGLRPRRTWRIPPARTSRPFTGGPFSQHCRAFRSAGQAARPASLGLFQCAEAVARCPQSRVAQRRPRRHRGAA